MDKWRLWEHDRSKFIITIDQDAGLDVIFNTADTDYYISLPGSKADRDEYLSLQELNNQISIDQAKLDMINNILDKDPNGILRYDSDNILRNKYESEAKDLNSEIQYCIQARNFIHQEEQSFIQRQWDAKKLSDDTVKEIHRILLDCNIDISSGYRGEDDTHRVPLYVVALTCEINELESKIQILKDKLESELSDVDMNLQEDGNLILFYKEGL